MATKMCRWYFSLLLILALAVAAEEFNCAGMISKMGTIVTKESDIIQEVGTSYDAVCIFNSSLDVNNVFMKKSGNGSRLEHKVLNDTAIKVTVKEDKPVEYNLECKANSVLTICFKTVRFGYPPQDVQDFSCISHNWQELNCTWNVPNNPVGVTYVLTYVLPGHVTQSPCPENSKYANDAKTSWCQWASNTNPQFVPREMYNFTFNATNALGYRVYYYRNYDIEEIVLPDPVVQVSVSAVGTNKLNASWKLPHPIDVFPGGVRHQVSVEINDTKELVKSEIMETSKSDMVLGKVYPMEMDVPYAYVDYNVQIRIHTGKGSIRENMWSDPVSITRKTKPMRPRMSPNPNVTGFEVMNDMSYRNIYITWQQIDPLEKAGPNFEYVIEVYKSGEEKPLNISPVVLTSSYAKFTKMDFFEYRFDIYAANSEGRGKEKTSIIVPEKSKLLGGMSFFTAIVYEDSFGKKVYALSWKPPKLKKNQEKITSYKLYWCRKTTYESRCENILHSETILDTSMMEYNLTGLENDNYMFGIAAYSPTSSSGMKWAGCVVKYNEARPAMQKVQIRNIKSRSVKLGWELQCLDRAGVVTGFNISYCEGTMPDFGECRDGTEKHDQIMDESAESFEVKHLHPNRSYLFSVAVLSRTVPSGWSTPKVAVTDEDRPSGIPQGLTVHTSNTSAVLRWRAPLLQERNGFITYYTYSYSYREQHNEIYKNRTESTGEINTVTFTKLEPYQNYTVQVRACTRIGCSHEAAVQQIHTKVGVPGKIKYVDYDRVNRALSWEFDNEDRNGPTKNIEIRVEYNQSNIINKSLPGEHISVTLDELGITCEEEQELLVAVRAINEDEEGNSLGGEWLEKDIVCSMPGRVSCAPDVGDSLKEKEGSSDEKRGDGIDGYLDVMSKENGTSKVMFVVEESLLHDKTPELGGDVEKERKRTSGMKEGGGTHDDYSFWVRVGKIYSVLAVSGIDGGIKGIDKIIAKKEGSDVIDGSGKVSLVVIGGDLDQNDNDSTSDTVSNKEVDSRDLGKVAVALPVHMKAEDSTALVSNELSEGSMGHYDPYSKENDDQIQSNSLTDQFDSFSLSSSLTLPLRSAPSSLSTSPISSVPSASSVPPLCPILQLLMNRKVNMSFIKYGDEFEVKIKGNTNLLSFLGPDKAEKGLSIKQGEEYQTPVSPLSSWLVRGAAFDSQSLAVSSQTLRSSDKPRSSRDILQTTPASRASGVSASLLQLPKLSEVQTPSTLHSVPIPPSPSSGSLILSSMSSFPSITESVRRLRQHNKKEK